MGEIYNLQDGLYKYELPPMPTREEDILFFDKPKKDQYWLPPDLSVFRRLSITDKRDFVEKIRGYWKDGLWFFNNGEPTYITGLHFDFLTLHNFSTIETGDKKPRFYQSQKEDFYFRDLTWREISCFGRIFYKPRRYGMSLEEMAEAYYRAVQDFGRQVGMMSNEWTKTLTSLFRPLVNSMLRRPKYMRAGYYSPSGKIPKKELLFNDGKVPEENEDGDILTEFLDGWITPKPTTTAAFDGDKLAYGVFDEVFKWTNASPKETVAIHKKSIEVGGRPVGKLSVLSTMGDSENYLAAVRDGVEMYYESDPKVLDGNGRTTNGLWHYFVSGLYMYNENYADKYGYLDKDRAYEEIMNERAKYTPGTQAYVYECRRVPLEIEDALTSATFSTVFDKKRIEAKLTILRATPKDQLPYVEGSFEEDNVGKVHWVPDLNGGPWKLATLPYKDKDVDRSNRWKKDYDGNIELMPNAQGAVGYDPRRIAEVDSKTGILSRAAILAFQKYDYYGNGGANKYAAIYVNTPDDPDEPTYESIKCSKFYGFPVMIERNVEGPRKVYRSQDMKCEALMLKGDDGIHGTLIHARNNVVKNMVDLFQRYLRKPTAEKEIDWLMQIPFKDLLVDMKDFDPKKTQFYDVMMANLQLMAGLKKVHYTLLNEENMYKKGEGISAMTPKRGKSNI